MSLHITYITCALQTVQRKMPLMAFIVLFQSKNYMEQLPTELLYILKDFSATCQ